MKHKRLLVLTLSATMILSMTACNGNSNEVGDSKDQTTTTTTSATKEPNSELENDVNWDEMSDIDGVDTNNEAGTGEKYESGKLAGEVSALCYYDLATTQKDNAEIFAKRFGGTINTEICNSGSAYFDRLAALISADDSPDIVRYDWMAFPFGTSKNMFTSLDDWLDMDSPVWANEKSVIEDFAYAGDHYYFPSNIQTNFAIIYRPSVFEEAGLDDPMELYFDNNWTWDTFEDLMNRWCSQDSENIGFTGGSWSSMMFINTTGEKVIDVNETEIVNNLKNQNVQRTMDWISGLNLKKYIGSGFVDPGDAFTDGKLLFLGMGLTWGYESVQTTLFKTGETEDVAALPFPRDPNADAYYMSSDSFGFLVPKGATNVQGAVGWILSGRLYETDEEIIAERYAEKTSTDPVYYPKCPECKYDFTKNGEDALTVCPKCNAARRQKFKAIYSEEQMQVLDDMINPEKFKLVFDNTTGFGDDFSSFFIGDESTIFDGPLYYGSSFTQLRDKGYGSIESYLDPFRTSLSDAVTE